MYGAMFGDYVGSIYEWHNIKTKDFPLTKPRCFLTDDSFMTIAVAQACNNWPEHKDLEAFQEDVKTEMIRIGLNYPDKGYGNRFRKWLHSSHPQPYRSCGNGSAMRVSPCALVAESLAQAEALAEASALPSHNHPEGVKGAKATAAAIYMARTGSTMQEIEDYIKANYYPLGKTLDEIRPDYQFEGTCQETVPQAIQAFLESTDFEDAIRNAISLGGDSDTLAAITGAMAEAYYGMPYALCKELDEVVEKSCYQEEREIVKHFRTLYAPPRRRSAPVRTRDTGPYCQNGCPFGEGPATCMRSLRSDTCPIERLYREVLELRKGGQRCAYCSQAHGHPEGHFPANSCGQCNRYCPACSAPNPRPRRRT